MSFGDIVIDATCFPYVQKWTYLTKNIKTFNLMENVKTIAYEEPRLELFAIKAEAVFCGSPVPPGEIESGEEGDEL